MKEIKAFVKPNRIQKVIENGKTPDPGDGIIYLSAIEDAFQVKTGESLKRFDL
ncbi:hypothetical protein [Pricia sp.]|uniref:hypothetical protein n=1 Tax=Pricia sp. TaxID=2268138 RepID=UPI003593FEA6